MNFKSIARRWAETWSAAWPDKDIEAMAAFYAPNATYLSVPFRQPDRGVEGVRAYLRREFDVESEIECWFSTPIVEGYRAAIEWWASWVEGGDDLTLAGSTILTFNDAGLITDHRDYWNQINDRRPPYPGWTTNATSLTSDP